MSKKILVIEDEEPLLKNIMMFLQAEGFDTVGAMDGPKGLNEAWQYLPDLIICDIMLPGLDGYKILEKIRCDERTVNVPFVFLTAKAAKSDMRRGMELGADDYITKPFTLEELSTSISTRLRKQETIEQTAKSRVDELRDSIVTSLPHGFRTPLTAIIGFTDLLIEDFKVFSDMEKLDMLHVVRENAFRLNDLTRNFLLSTQLELIAADKEQLKAFRSEWVEDLPIVINRAASEKSYTYKRMQDLVLDLDESITAAAISEEYMSKLVAELVDNAFNYSKPGTPVVVKTLHAKPGYFSLVVLDHGRGMTREQIAKIGAFIQFDRNYYEQQGVGQGLHLVKRLVELLEGQCVVDSEPDIATRVTITLPIK